MNMFYADGLICDTSEGKTELIDVHSHCEFPWYIIIKRTRQCFKDLSNTFRYGLDR